MKIGQMAEVDCNAFQVARGITTTSQNFTENGVIMPTAGLFANEDVTIYTKDCYGNVTKKILAAGIQMAGAFVNVWASESSGEITKVAANKLTLIF